MALSFSGSAPLRFPPAVQGCASHSIPPRGERLATQQNRGGWTPMADAV